MSESPPPTPESGRLAELRASARGWHGVQLAVIGFIGLCGVLQQEESSDPELLQVLAGILALVALALACLATYLVGRAAWPLYGAQARADDDPDDLESASGRLRTGLILTFVAVALLALSAASGWWPTEESAEGGGGSVELQAGGSSWCGELGEPRPGEVTVVTDGQLVAIPFGSLTAIRAVGSCA